MKFVKPASATPGPITRSGGSVHERPSWLQEWIANKGKYVRLTCGCRVDLNERNILTEITKRDGVRRVWCYSHNEVFDIKESIGLYEYHFNRKPEPLPDIPPF